MADDQGQQPEKKPVFNKWVFALILIAVAVFMYLSVGYKIISRGP